MNNKRSGIFAKFKLQAISYTSTNNSLMNESMKWSSCPPSEGAKGVDSPSHLLTFSLSHFLKK